MENKNGTDYKSAPSYYSNFAGADLKSVPSEFISARQVSCDRDLL